MKINVQKTSLPEVLKIERYAFTDFRGMYGEIYARDTYREAGIEIDFKEQDFSMSYKNVLRGLHGDSKTWKLISCLHGSFYLVVLNFDRESEYFGKWEAFTLSPENRLQILVPPKHGNAHLVLTDQAIFHYNQSEYYFGAENQFTVRWDDPKFNIKWPIKNPILSKRDAEVPYIKD